MIEAAAQLAGVAGQSDPTVPALAGLKLTALRVVKILGSARPGDGILFEACITGRLGSLIHAEASASVEGHRIFSAELTLSGA